MLNNFKFNTNLVNKSKNLEFLEKNTETQNQIIFTHIQINGIIVTKIDIAYQ